jgi:hypothetical protein
MQVSIPPKRPEHIVQEYSFGIASRVVQTTGNHVGKFAHRHLSLNEDNGKQYTENHCKSCLKPKSFKDQQKDCSGDVDYKRNDNL